MAASPPDRPIVIELVVRSAHPALLEGLEIWLQLGLLSDDLVRQICQDHLSCPVRFPASVTQPDDFLPPAAISRPVVAPRSRVTAAIGAPSSESTGLVTRVLRSLMAELSVRWLLFLGVFLVVVSSAVIAASQWQNVPRAGQYGILLTYTLAFWGVSLVTGRNPALRLTSRMLQTATLLMIPANFWMMDGFRLWDSLAGATIAAIAALSLSSILAFSLRPSASAIQQTWLTTGMAIALSWLHWGWQLGGFPLVACYVGTIGTAIVLVSQDASDRETAESAPSFLSLPALILAFSTLLLSARAVLMVPVPVHQMALALGICGWLLGWLSRRDASRAIWTQAGTVMLLLGWAIAISVTPPWQAIAISGLGLGLLADSLRRSGQMPYLTVSFLVGLQGWWLCWRVIPLDWQANLLACCTQLAGTATMPEALLGLGFFPYLLLLVWLAFRFRSWQRPELADHAEFLALILGLGLTAVSLGNPLVRAANLTLSAATLGIVVWSRFQPGAPLVYLTHATGLGAIAAFLYWGFPTLNLNQWAAILLAGMLAEWSVSIPPRSDASPFTLTLVYRQSAWMFGILLASISYPLLLTQQVNHLLVSGDPVWGWIWLATPIMLTVLNRYRQSSARLAGGLSVLALLIWQPLMLDSLTGRLVGLGTAALLLGINTRQLRHLLPAGLTVGFGLGFIGVAAWEILVDDRTVGTAVNLLAIAALGLWSGRLYCHRQNGLLAGLYARAGDGWAVGITGFTLFPLLTLGTMVVYLDPLPAKPEYVLAAGLLLLATGFRLWQGISNLGFYGAAWSLEFFLLGGLAFGTRSLDSLAIAHLALSFTTQLAGDWWITRRTGRSSQNSPPGNSAYLSSFHVIPLLYALLGTLLAHHHFTDTTGLFTLAAALVGIGVGRRLPSLKPLTYLSILGISLGAYELLIYHLMQASGGNPGDGIVLLATLATGLAIAIRFLIPWLTPYWHLSSPEIRAIAHLHWGAGSILLISAPLLSLSQTGGYLWSGIAALLSLYALLTARASTCQRFPTPPPAPSAPSPSHTSYPWTYAGILQAILSLSYLLHLSFPTDLLLDWSATLAALLAATLYLAPWQRWGWDWQPWRNSAVVVPGVSLLLLGWTANIQSLLIAAAFYVWLAKMERQTRISYLGVAIADWALLRLLGQYATPEPLWYAAILGGSLLYVAQIDPGLRSPSQRETRHLLRMLAGGLIGLTALYQAELGIAGISLFFTGILMLGLHLGFVFAGILVRVRAFLYIGTIAFVLQVLRQLWRFIADYSLLLWAILAVAGLTLIWIAATFEARRTQVTALLQYWISELEAWD